MVRMAQSTQQVGASTLQNLDEQGGMVKNSNAVGMRLHGMWKKIRIW